MCSGTDRIAKGRSRGKRTYAEKGQTWYFFRVARNASSHFPCVDVSIATYNFPSLLSRFALRANGFDPSLGCLPISE